MAKDVTVAQIWEFGIYRASSRTTNTTQRNACSNTALQPSPPPKKNSLQGSLISYLRSCDFEAVLV